MSSAVILEPSGQTDSTLKFTAGLIMAVPFEAELYNLSEPSRLRLKIKYPDQRTQVILPRPEHLKPLYLDGPGDGKIVPTRLANQVLSNFFPEQSEGGHNLRLLTTVLVSHQVWSEACNVDISIALSVPEADIGKRKCWQEGSSFLMDLCKSVKVSVAPKPIKRSL